MADGVDLVFCWIHLNDLDRIYLSPERAIIEKAIVKTIVDLRKSFTYGHVGLGRIYKSQQEQQLENQFV